MHVSTSPLEIKGTVMVTPTLSFAHASQVELAVIFCPDLFTNIILRMRSLLTGAGTLFASNFQVQSKLANGLWYALTLTQIIARWKTLSKGYRIA